MKRTILALAGTLALALSMTATAVAAPAQQASVCGQSSAASGGGSALSLQERADLFFDGSIQALQKAHCGAEFANPQN